MRLLDFLFDRARSDPIAADDPLIDEAVHRAVEVVDPRIAMVPDYARQLRPAVTGALDHLRSAVGSMDGVHEASAAGWSADPLIRVVFARPADVADTVSRSPEVQQFFGTEPGADEVAAVLAMAFNEKRVIEPALRGGSVQQDVVRRLWFSDHRIPLTARDLDSLRPMIGRAMFHHLLIAAAGRFSEQEKQIDQFGIAHSLLQARVRLLKAHERTLAASFEEPDEAGPAAELGRLEEQLARTGSAIRDLTRGGNALDRKLHTLCDVLTHADEMLTLDWRTVRVDSLNTIVDDPSLASGTSIRFGVFRAPGDPPRTRAAVLIRFARSALVGGGLAIDEVARTL